MKNRNYKIIYKQVALVTGGSSGIGNAIVKKFIKSGLKVYFTYKNKNNNDLKKLAILKNKNLIPIKCDMSKTNEINRLKNILKKEKKIDILINNVGSVLKRSSFFKF